MLAKTSELVGERRRAEVVEGVQSVIDALLVCGFRLVPAPALVRSTIIFNEPMDAF